MAMASLATMYATGDGVARDEAQARELFDLAESLGLDVTAMREAAGV